MLHNEARKLLIEAWNKTHNAKEIAECCCSMSVRKPSAKLSWSLDISIKRSLCMLRNRSIPDVQEKRKNWREHMQENDSKHLVFLDESGVNTNLTRHYDCSQKNERAVDSAPINTPCNTTILSFVRLNEKTYHTVYQGGTTQEWFEEYLKTIRIPTLSKTDVIVMDNMRSHHAKIVKQVLNETGISYVYLPLFKFQTVSGGFVHAIMCSN